MPKEIIELDNIAIDKEIKEILRDKPSQDTNIVKSLKEFNYILEKL